MSKESRIKLLCAVLYFISTFCLAASGELSREVEFKIPPQSLADAIIAFSDQTGIQLVTAGEDVSRLFTRGVSGRLPISAALRQLLHGTPLAYAAVGESTVALVNQVSREPAGPAVQPVREKTETQSTAGNVESMVVTGSHIRGVAAQASPVIVYDREEIEQSGAATAEEFIRKMPQNFALLEASTLLANGGNEQAGANRSLGASLNLHGIGVGETLVLVNGRRLAPSGIDGSFVDVSMIPLQAIERIEVLTDGASAIYGADAVAGAVNFILRKNFDGAQAAVRYGDSTAGGAAEHGGSLTWGRSWEKGNAMLAYDHQSQHELLSEQRDFVPRNLGGCELLPAMRRDGLYLTARANPVARFEVFAEALLARRSFQQRCLDSIVGLNTAGNSRQYGAVLGAGYDFAGDWRAELVGNLSAAAEEQEYDAGIRGLINTGSRTHLRSVELHADGAIFEAPGGKMRASFGLGLRGEEFSGVLGGGVGSFDRHRARNAYGGYSEVSIPLIGQTNARRGAHQLKLSLAARYDRYGSEFSSADPKIGVLWTPMRGLDLRGAYATSYRAPLLAQTNGTNALYQALPLRNPAVASGTTLTLFAITPGNPALRAEKATSVSAGFDFKPEVLPGLSVSATWFALDLTGRIARPPYDISPQLAFLQFQKLAPFIDLSPDPAAVERLFAENTVFDPFGIGAAGIEAVFDTRFQNIASTTATGLDFHIRHDLSARFGDLAVLLAGAYLRELKFQAASTTPATDLVGTLFNPVDLRLQGAMRCTHGPVSAALEVDYWSDYRNNLVTPMTRVASWTTLSAQVVYRTQDRFSKSWLQDFTVTLSAENIMDRRPPGITDSSLYQNFGLDPTNATLRGRFLALQISKRW